jgi:hypothetical protein
MPTYEIVCEKCEVKLDKRLTFSEFDEVKSGLKELACVCGAPLKFGFAPGTLGFIMKEGPSGGWVTKSIKENQYRKQRGAVMKQRQTDHVRTPKLQPNYKGEETGTWREAKEAARKEKGDLSASSYDHLLSKETRTK